MFRLPNWLPGVVIAPIGAAVVQYSGRSAVLGAAAGFAAGYAAADQLYEHTSKNVVAGILLTSAGSIGYLAAPALGVSREAGVGIGAALGVGVPYAYIRSH